MKSITPEELQTKIEAGEKVAIIDVREDEEVAQGMIPGAVHIPLGSLENRLGELDSGTSYVINCKSGKRSAKACEILEHEGYDVTNLEGGFDSWKGEKVF